MYLKTLVLKGFKSFANRSVLQMGPGVSVIVGPNGSGKSNITDAILWVLGEQSAKALRGQSMDDVIFAGSSAHKAVSVAEVDMVLDNSDGTIPLDFDEVVITRRMYRSGESEYLINASPARLMDILDILHDSGLGRNAQSIISQGSLESILMSKPEDRRALIEEAAGILKHKRRKERSARKIAAMDANLTRVRDISREIDKQLKPLERQAQKAQKHAEASEELRELEISLLIDDLETLQALWTELETRIKQNEDDVDLAHYQLTEKEKEYDKLRALFEEKGLFAGDLAEQRRRARTILVSLDSGLMLLEEKGKNMVDRLSDLRATLFKAQQKYAEDKESYEKLEAERTETAARMKALYAQLNECRRESEVLRRTRTESDTALSKLNAQLRGDKKAIEDCRIQQAKNAEAIQSLKLEHEMLKRRYEQSEAELASHQDNLAQSRARVEALEKQVEEIEQENKLASRDIDKRVRIVEERKQNVATAHDTLTSVSSEIKGLSEVNRALTAASPALKWASEHVDDFYSEMYPVSSLFKAPEDLEQITERLLGIDLFGMMVADIESANLLVERLVQEKVVGNGVTVFPRDGLVSAKVKVPGMTRLVESLQFEKENEPIAEMLLGDVYLVGSMREAFDAHIKYPKARFATRDGAIVWPSGKITIGMQVENYEGVLTRNRRLDALNEQLPQIEELLASAEAAVVEAEEALKLAQNDGFEIAQRLAAVIGEKDAAVKDLARLESVLNTCIHDRNEIANRMDSLKSKMTTSSPLSQEYDERLERLSQNVERLEEEIATAEEARRKAFDEDAEATARLSECQVEIATVSERQVHLQTRLIALKKALDENEKTIESAQSNADLIEVLRERIEPLHTIYTELQLGVVEIAEKLQVQASLEQEGSDSLRDAVRKAEAAVAAARTAEEEKKEALNNTKLEQGKLEVSVEESVRKIVVKTDLPLEQAIELKVTEPRSVIESRILKLQRKIANLGPVNAVAEQEYAALKERHDFIQAQVNDLESARKALEKIINAIDKKMRVSFLKTFEEVDKNFQEIFATLFPGGTGYLSLTDPDFPETTGIEVNAQPKGKRLKKMTLMSGGEKSLTAMALLFALCKTRTVPFYVLDEVEAALDDVNLRRLLAFIDAMRNETQFIMISHQRSTMEQADCLYGVSMQADGVSQLISRKLNRETKQEETQKK